MSDDHMPEEKPPVVKGIAEADYQRWRHHPVSKVMLQYFEDYAAALQSDVLMRWKSGNKLIADEQQALGRVLTLQEIVELPFSAVVAFYEESKEIE